MRDTQREAKTQREKKAPCRETDVELDPRSLGSCPELKAGAQPPEPPRHPKSILFKIAVVL